MGQAGSRTFTFTSQASNGRYSLHPSSCQDLPSDVEKMQTILQKDRGAIERLQLSSEDAYLQMYPLHIAAYMSHFKCVKFLLENGAQVNTLVPTKFGRYSALEFAIMSGIDGDNRTEIVKLLLNQGAEVNITWNDNYNTTNMLESLLSEASYPRDIFKLLLENNALTEDLTKIKSVYWRNSDICTPLIKAIITWNLDGMKLLLFHGAKMFFRTNLNSSKGPCSVVSIPHFVVQETYNMIKSNESLRDHLVGYSIKVLQIYQQFGGNLWIKHASENGEEEDVLEYLSRNPETCDTLGDFVPQMEKMMKMPLTLQCLSRNVVRESMGRDYWKNIEVLHVPIDVKSFLTYMDINVFDGLN